MESRWRPCNAYPSPGSPGFFIPEPHVQDQNLVEIAVSLVTAALGWVVKMIWGAQKEQREKQEALAGKVTGVEIEMAREYVRRDEFSAAVSNLEKKIDTGFQRVFDRLDGKADK